MKRFLRFAAAAAARRVLRRSGRRVGVALVYHGVADEGADPAGNLVPVVARRRFEAQLRHLQRHYRVVRAADLRDAVSSRQPGDPIPVAITFDDDLASHHLVAAPLLVAAGLPATFFLCGATLDGPSAFWWERLQRVADRRGVRAAAEVVGSAGGSIHGVARFVEALDPEARDAVHTSLLAAAGPDPEDSGLRATAVRSLATTPGLEVGFHTRRHDALPALADERLAAALVDGRPTLAALAQAPLTTIAYPHGQADLRVASATRAAGYLAGFTTVDEVVRPETDRLLMGRVDPSYLEPDELAWHLASRLAGLPATGRVGHVARRLLRRWLPSGSAAARRRGTEPASRSFGFDRGTPVDRFYIEQFLDRHGRRGGAIAGRVVEIGDDTYARKFAGGPLTSVDILDVDSSNPRATIVGDLAGLDGVADGAFDCVVCTQTLLLIYDVRRAVAELWRVLAPGGSLLVTVPGISQVCRPEMERFGDFWRFTDASLRRLLEERFDAGDIQLETFGNVFSASSFLYGLAVEELPRAKLDAHDPDYQVIVAARAVKRPQT